MDEAWFRRQLEKTLKDEGIPSSVRRSHTNATLEIFREGSFTSTSGLVNECLKRARTAARVKRK